MPKVKTWMHSRKGKITGLEVGGDGEWVDIQLADDHQLDYKSRESRGQIDESGEVIRVRRSFLTEVRL